MNDDYKLPPMPVGPQEGQDNYYARRPSQTIGEFGALIAVIVGVLIVFGLILIVL